MSASLAAKGLFFKLLPVILVFEKEGFRGGASLFLWIILVVNERGLLTTGGVGFGGLITETESFILF